MEDKEVLRIIHFNDVYDIEPGDKDPIGGVARFKTAIDEHLNDKTLVLFSGDAFSPSLLSQTYKGQQMVLPLNSFHIDVACLGNHDMDFEEEQSLKLQKQTNFPWVLSNFFYKGTTDRLLECKQYVILEKFGFKFGIFGLAQKQWEDTLVPFYRGKLDYVDFIEYGQLMVDTLKNDHQCDFIIALTHMMGYNDTKLAKTIKGIDLILGGHDHTIRSQQINNVPVIKSGTNFKHLSVVSIQKQKGVCPFHNQKYGVSVELINIDDKIKPDPVLEKHVEQFMKDIEVDRNKVAFVCGSDLDLRFQTIRKTQCEYLRLASEWYITQIPCDFALLNSGNQRNNTIYHKGPILKKDILNNCQDMIVSKKLTGKQALKVIQNAVSMYPNLSGRFSNFAGITFTWDPMQQQGSRVLVDTIRIRGNPIVMQQQYIVISHHFQSVGGDGFTGFRQVQQFVFKQQQPPYYNTTLINLYLDPNSPQAQRFAEKHSQYYDIKQNQYGNKQIHFDPTKIPSNATML